MGSKSTQGLRWGDSHHRVGRFTQLRIAISENAFVFVEKWHWHGPCILSLISAEIVEFARGGGAVMMRTHNHITEDSGPIRNAFSRFWSWLRDTVTGHETRGGEEAIPYCPCYYDD